MQRSDWQGLARLRLKEAEALLNAGFFEGAYYLGGYVVECALKACISKQTQRFEFPNKKRTEAAYKHDPSGLVSAAGLAADLEKEMLSDKNFAQNWAIAKDWSEASRYDRLSKAKAEDLLTAIGDKRHGVLRWLKAHW